MGNKIRELTMGELNVVSGGDAADDRMSNFEVQLAMSDINNPICTPISKPNVSASYFHFAGAVHHRK